MIRMHAMWLGFTAAILIAGVAAVVVVGYGDSAAERFSSTSTRL